MPITLEEVKEMIKEAQKPNPIFKAEAEKAHEELMKTIWTFHPEMKARRSKTQSI